MIVLSGADLTLADRILGPASLIIEGDRIVDIRAGSVGALPGSVRLDLAGHYIVPGFVDLHVHGVGGHDVLDGPDAVRAIAARLPSYGVTAFSPTTIACPPPALRSALGAVRDARLSPVQGSARVLPAHLESNFLNPDYKGAQPRGCLRVPPAGWSAGAGERPGAARSADPHDDPFTGADILAEIARARPDVATITLAPELPRAIDLIRELAAMGLRVSLGHSGASFDEGMAAISAGARQGTHVFNRMPPLDHREPGLVGAILHSEETAAEVICDLHHVHPAMVEMVVMAKGTGRVMAVTDGTAGSGLPLGTRVSLGGYPITVRDGAAYLDDGTLAGSVLTMDRAFQNLAGPVGLTLVEAATLCATTPAREAGLAGHGVITKGAVADLAVLDRDLRVIQTYVGGTVAFSRL